MAPTTELEEIEEKEDDSQGPCFGQRHSFALLCSLLITVLYCVRVNLGIIIVAIVNNTAVLGPSKENGTSTECPAPETNETGNRFTTDGSLLWSRDLQGLVLGSFHWGYMVFQLLGGTLSQRIGGKWILMIAVMSNAVLSVISPLAITISPYLLIAVRIAEGLSQGVVVPAIQAMLGRWIPQKEASFLYAVAFSGSLIGTVVGQIVSGLLCQSSWGWSSAFYASAALASMALAPWLMLVHNSPEEHPKISAEELAYISRHLGTRSQEKSNRLGVPWLHILTDTAVWAYITGRVCLTWLFALLLNCLPQYLSDVLHFDISTNGVLASLPHVVHFFVSLFVGRLSDLAISKSCARPVVTRKIMYFGGCFGCACCMCAVVFFECNITASVALLMILMGFGGISGVHIAANVGELSPEFSGTIIALANTFSCLSGFAVPIVTDHLTVHGRVNEWSKVFYIGAGVTMFGGTVFATFASSERRQWNSGNWHECLINIDDNDRS